jgi:hypothetical protein
VPADYAKRLTVSSYEESGTRVLRAGGFLDSSTYLALRDAIIKAALDEPRAVIVDVTSLVVPAPSAWAVVTSARWLIVEWPDVPMAVVCEHSTGRTDIVRNGITRYVPVYASTTEAIAALSQREALAVRRRARAELSADTLSLSRSRDLVAEWLTAWQRPELISVAKLVVTVFVENVLAHTGSAPALRLESKGDYVTVAVADGSTAPATRRECSSTGSDEVSGLSIVAALCRTWGNSPTPSGKTVWAVIGPENRL